MDNYQLKTAIVIYRMRQRGFSEQSIQSYKKIFASIESYLHKKEVVYSPELGEKMLALNDDAFFTEAGEALRKACIHKLNDVYRNGDIKESIMSPRKSYRHIILSEQFEDAITGFMVSVEDKFSIVQQENVSRRVRLFFKYLQANGVSRISDVAYEDIAEYHNSMLYLKPESRIVEESSIHQLLHYLSDKGEIAPGKYLYMYLLEKGYQFKLDAFDLDEQLKVEQYRFDSLAFSADMFLQTSQELLEKYISAGYTADSCKEPERALLYLYLFLDLNHLGYLPEIADIWLNSLVIKRLFGASPWKSARRTLNVFCDMISNGEPRFYKVYRKGISGLDELPDWCKNPLMEFVSLRAREKLDESTVKNDIYSILRFLRFILEKGYSSFMGISGEDVVEFNLKDLHGSPEGKNSCNARIRRFLRYIEREGYTASSNLYMSLQSTAATVETVVQIFTDDEILAIKDYVAHASTPLEIRDSAIILLGCDMGVRGCDIAALKLTDIDWRKQCIRFRQDKTDVDVYLSMPTAVGNAIFRYLRDARNKNTKSDRVFISISAPYVSIKRHVCYQTLQRILPGRNVSGSGFHVTRKTFSTNRLNNGVKPAAIADALGHASSLSLTPYLSLDGCRMAECALSLEDLRITKKGGF